MIGRQAVPLVSPSSPHIRLYQHLLLTVVVGVAAVTALPARSTAPAGNAAPPRSIGIPASPSLAWLPVRIPGSTTVTPDKTVADPAEPPTIEGTDTAPVTQADLAATVQETADSRADTPGSLVAMGSPGSSPVTLVSTRELTLWSDDQADADELGRIPRLALLDAIGPARDGRIPVRLDLPDALTPSLAWVDAASLTPTSHLGLASPWARPFAFGLRTVSLTVPYRTQLDGSAAAGANCGPASLGMIFDSYGIGVATAALRERAHRFQGTSGPDTGFLLEVLQKVVGSYGLEGQDLLENGRYRRWTLDDVRRHLRAGHPVIPQLRYRLMPGREWAGVSYDHYLVLTGVDGDDFLFNDPIPWSGKGQGRITASQLLRAWANSDAPMAALAVADPR